MGHFRVKLGGKMWRVRLCPRMTDYGHIAYGSNHESRLIKLRIDQADHEMLDTLIHESLHAQFPELEEHAVEAKATEMAKFILRVFHVERRGTMPR